MNKPKRQWFTGIGVYGDGQLYINHYRTADHRKVIDALENGGVFPIVVYRGKHKPVFEKDLPARPII